MSIILANKEMQEGPEKEHVLDIVEAEGFDYAFQAYSHFETITDDYFHILRKQYIAAQEELAKYIGFQ